ncbi:MAG: 16S rRNA (guanine(966)-N(2))-methyltransferase RsmD [Candidatus Thermofonsia Clade 1 bacterium]|jgi:16S rRNA (guanine(966)-N(2))-methyltransferase RsmD|uniref:16S rRNA (Guanine(966)-N(2))-methyltransferase RsmD n=1 Tax=Candidatus Thermofonsia Clade 1 bacterium TaxID=2364210 RepID=A0A2M8PDU2_9CHLR|nr:MAG: 16S rRNA (guanine(966)-N(2))-methyltransferase RsmD [Candidatus Thermofonsia Clade 1 bacterium]PJF42799.1 MAG: 16S rRNA (guanine(966)-N(2))-methyltransferase RsmD [Candidatus Thermofonsia Clade 1 bacterium]RMF48805.1 MAG: 16S rRNA (guanine(966)-N(2))-methyltransferase RsmD [Chloroflexota bacterium]
MPIRVIGGIAKGRKLKPVPGEGTRPIMDRVKEALFSIIGDRVLEASFLDLYAGTGSVGIEALSRGAAHATFVEKSGIAVQTIKANLLHVGLDGFAEVLRADVRDYLRVEPSDCFELIYIAPPQYRGLWLETLRLLDDNIEYLCPDGWAIVQIDPQERQAVDLKNLRAIDERKYGNTLLWFFERFSA